MLGAGEISFLRSSVALHEHAFSAGDTRPRHERTKHVDLYNRNGSMMHAQV